MNTTAIPQNEFRWRAFPVWKPTANDTVEIRASAKCALACGCLGRRHLLTCARHWLDVRVVLRAVPQHFRQLSELLETAQRVLRWRCSSGDRRLAFSPSSACSETRPALGPSVGTLLHSQLCSCSLRRGSFHLSDGWGSACSINRRRKAAMGFVGDVRRAVS
jgi:hypothetical protein